MTKKESEKRIREFSLGLAFVRVLENIDEVIYGEVEKNDEFPKEDYTMAAGVVIKNSKHEITKEVISCEYQIQISIVHNDSVWIDEGEIASSTSVVKNT